MKEQVTIYVTSKIIGDTTPEAHVIPSLKIGQWAVHERFNAPRWGELWAVSFAPLGLCVGFFETEDTAIQYAKRLASEMEEFTPSSDHISMVKKTGTLPITELPAGYSTKIARIYQEYKLTDDKQHENGG